MNLETKVGLFVLLGLVIGGFSIMKLGDVRFEKRYTLYFVFEDIQNLRDKSLIKISGVEVGRVDKIELEQGRAKIRAQIQSDVPVYANARVKVKLTGIIGTQFLDLNPGTLESRRLKDGDTIVGEKTKSLNDLMEKLSDLIEGKEGKPGIGDHLQLTVANLRSITDALNAAIGLQKNQLVDIVDNLHQFSVDLKGATSDLHAVISSKKVDIETSLTKLRSILDRVDELLAKVQQGEGTIGKLVSDKEMGEEVKKTVTHLKETSESAKQVLARFTKVRSYWEFQLRALPNFSVGRADGGIRLQPREEKYYYLGVSNIGAKKDEFKNENDFEKKNTITALLGKEFGPITFEIGAIRSSAGIGLKYSPFKGVTEETDSLRWAKKFELNGQAFDFGRDELRGKTGNERKFQGPHFNLGAKYRVNRWINLGASVEDLAETQQVNINTDLIFEDKDLAYLFGFVSFAR